jgi:hypothetical protein
MMFSFLKAFTEVGYLKQGNQAWFCLDLIQVLCLLAEQGHAIAVREILSSPIGHCAGVLLLGVSQIKVQFHLSIICLRKTSLFLIILKQILPSIFSDCLQPYPE